ncbi:dimethylamine monooxygenase subunit DmmA family protein [Alteribacillus bidgolensis]|uniref:Dimethylamine monooxygenase subunit DmmA-like C-terminal domain-containing protein n=1 Tax=Alteribacillus bidgolensis TaxID=930129 RepID=A0A1G8R5D8_9BACI|nr:dimethylamine monooxygenase subunit DmmA family protein [Alteribacillus bidgolensis]SDJ11620.1 hypothetical protein SAMN05216352_12430 [Alteribacillus bidgolensis]
MYSIKFFLTREELSFNKGYVGEVKLVNGSIPYTISRSNEITINNTRFELPINLVELNKEEGRYLLLINTADYQEQKRLDLVRSLRNQTFELQAQDYSFFKLHSNCKKVLLLIDKLALIESLAIVHSLSINKIETQFFLKINSQQESIFNYMALRNYLQEIPYNNAAILPSSSYDKKVQSIFEKQKIGTNIFISGSFSMLDSLKQKAYEAGFSDEEIQYRGFGQKQEKIYCVKCYSYNKKHSTQTIECENCNTILDVSDHFSRRLNAYLGYIDV